eukprot:TRINITY_DN285_c0_g1_i1.p1 TRINITY_DN285_c0_g1~~TRINITY_DN285_c0_g1_i1.p1  ORF type:complete len:981 (+),score=309.38 TRINITY_DN285_c0_g1_i1:2188-5130(+)
MTNLQQVIDELRFLLQRDAIENTDELTNLLAEYSRHCHDVNVRLRRCGDRLKQGLMSEALHLAEASPNLLDVVALLDFPEREQFVDVIGMYFLTPPEPLLLDVASELNEAYAQHEPLQKLLDAQRLLALGHAPLSERLTVLRALAELDAAAHWESDIREMERARLQQMSAEGRAAAKHGDTNTIKTLLKEAQADHWYEPVPPQLVRELKALTNQVLRGTARQRIEELSNELYGAFSALDASQGRTLRDEWNRHQQVAQVAEDEDLWQQVSPIFEWLTDEDRKQESEQVYNSAVAQLTRAIDQNQVTSAQLKKLGSAVDRMGRELPSPLDSQYRQRLVEVERAEKSRKRLLFGGSAVAFATVAGLFGLMVNWSLQAEQTRRLATTVATLIDEGKLTEARQLASQQSPRTSSEAWMAVQKKLVDAEAADSDRVKRLRSEIETANESVDPVQIEAALKEARGLAKTTDEKIEVGKLQSGWQQRVRKETAARDQQFRESLAAADNAVKELDAALSQADSSEKKEWRRLLDDADAHVAKLRTLRSEVSRELAGQTDAVESRLAASRKSIFDVTRRSDLIDKLTDAALLPPGQSHGKSGRYENTLREYVTMLPNDSRAMAFKAEAESSPLPGALSRQKLLDRWKRLRPLDDKDVEARLREIRTFLTEHPSSPDCETMGKYEKWLSSLQWRFAEDGDPDEGGLRKLTTLFDSKFIKDGHVLRDDGGHSYYLVQSPKAPFGSIVTFKYFVGFNGESKEESLKAENLVTKMAESPPQATISAKVKSTVRNITIENWPDYFRDLFETIRDADDVDPYLRYLLLFKVVELAGSGDQLLEQELAELRKHFTDSDLDRSVAWMDPRNESAVKSRKRAKELLLTVPSLEPIFTRAAARQKQLEADVFTTRFPIGWLDQTSQGEWLCRTRWSPETAHTLLVASPAEAKGQRVWQVVGRVNDKSIVIDTAGAKSAGEAAVVFATPVATESKTAQVP